MLETLLKVYYEAYLQYQSLILELTHNKISDWELLIMHSESKTTIFHMNGGCLNDLAAQGYIAFKAWLDTKNEDGADEFLQRAEIL